jgi:hypothetical protein
MPRSTRMTTATAVAPLHGRPTRNSTRTLRSADNNGGPLRRSARLAALQERRRESEENALRQQRERIAQTHRHVSRNNGQSIFASLRMLTQPSSVTTPRQRNSSNVFRTRTPGPVPSDSNERPHLVRQFPIRRRHGIMANPQVFNFPNENGVHRSVSIANLLQLTNRGTNTNFSGRVTARMSTGGLAARNAFASRRMSTGGNGILRNGDRANVFLLDNPELRDSVFNIGLILGNRYSSDSEDSYFQPRVIDPDAISEDESDEEPTEMRELTPAPSAPAPPPPVLSHRPVTRSMSSHPGFYDNPTPSTVISRPNITIKKKANKSGMCSCKKAGKSSSVKSEFLKLCLFFNFLIV